MSKLPKVLSAEYLLCADIYPGVHIRFEGGRETVLDWEYKPVLLDQGLVFVPGMEDLLPERKVTIPEPGYDTTIEVELPTGFTDDPVIVAIFRQFVAARASDTFQPGPVEIPSP